MNRPPFPKCSVAWCNQHATATSDLCGHHLRDQNERTKQTTRRENVLSHIREAETVEDLKAALLELMDLLEP